MATTAVTTATACVDMATTTETAKHGEMAAVTGIQNINMSSEKKFELQILIFFLNSSF